ncbi:hypothetical protein [uncultured Deinococcus sp.]|uniref:hypothetical protein n=1 Tax=uncultured Deinococcus sp. TaxID=158789 RepID=UPI0025F73CD7|nr:hypothetical protein [uncultured Deinococcus sp.]
MLQSNTLRRSTLAVLAATLTVGMVACGKSTPANAVTAVAVAAVSTDNQMTVGETATATANVTATGTAAKTVTWSTSAPAVASINSSTGAIVALTVGTTTITAKSTFDATKTASITLKVVAGGTTTTPTPAFNVRFGTAAATAATGFTNDTGAAFNGTSGWITEATAKATTKAPLDMTTAGRFRDPLGVDKANIVQGLKPEQYGMILMDCGSCSASTQKGPAAWEYKVNSGKYDVIVSVGDADKRNIDSTHLINVEGVSVVPSTAATAGSVKEYTKASISVTDGFLTVDSIGGTNTKINYIKVVPSAVQ